MSSQIYKITAHVTPWNVRHEFQTENLSAQTALLFLLEKWKSRLDKIGYAGEVLMYLSKAFYKNNHELLIAKLNAYGFSKPSLKLIYSSLKDRLQHIKINSTFSEWS